MHGRSFVVVVVVVVVSLYIFNPFTTRVNVEVP